MLSWAACTIRTDRSRRSTAASMNLSLPDGVGVRCSGLGTLWRRLFFVAVVVDSGTSTRVPQVHLPVRPAYFLLTLSDLEHVGQTIVIFSSMRRTHPVREVCIWIYLEALDQ